MPLLQTYHLLSISPNVDKSNPLFNNEDCQQLIDIYENYYPQVGYIKPWIGYFVIRDHEVVGSCGFTSAPSEGRVEIAYWTFAKYEGQGVASYACAALIEIALKENSSLIITAKTAPEFNASTKILQKNNFIYKGIVQDHEIGDAWLWELKG
jgi:[ribosomal protein S5]-alanine N-acetyltransferase